MVTGPRRHTLEGPLCSAGQSPFSSASNKAARLYGLYYKDAFSKEAAQEVFSRHMPGSVGRPAVGVRRG